MCRRFGADGATVIVCDLRGTADAVATLTEAGYVGEDVENILLKLIQAADFDIKDIMRALKMLSENLHLRPEALQEHSLQTSYSDSSPLLSD